ncbi:BgTH12-04171 [Blumeria graminis f. sp. triticale]|uniref:BgTH12-04171 n=1 Tax=Blumeria graminis f. sp. triticale TaxID=1689686 RepID=A0A9W4CX94_BLUGR|nr:BgTH12-04171 [Blumeria graminis f. sp. triticale]
MNRIRVLDDYYLAITLLITVVYQLLFFSVAYSLKFDKLTDFAGGTNFALLAILTLGFSGEQDARQIVASIFLVLWAIRLSGFLLFRILKTGKDDRFDDKRDKFFPFLGFWIFQMLWVWVVSLPVTVLNSPGVLRYDQPAFGTFQDVVGVIFYIVGLTMESVSDLQKYLFKARTTDKYAFYDQGLFAWSRHPNYFGDILTQFAIFMICVSPATHNYVSGKAYNILYATIIGPIFLTLLLMFVSGLPISERATAKKQYENKIHWEAYKLYTERTSILIPFMPSIYAKLPIKVKRTIFLEFPIYVFNPPNQANSEPPEERLGSR